jgi:hypothetical protein
MPDGAEPEYLIEFVRIGTSVKVSAIDPVTGTEACIIGPAHLSDAVLGKNAISKLRYVLARKNKGPGKSPAK